MNKVKVGFVGTGGIANYHLSHLEKMKEVKLVAFADVAMERAKASADKYQGRAYQDHRKMLEKEELDALYICVPPFAHTDAELIAAEKGIHLFVEKPIAITLEKALEFSAAIERNKIISSAGYQDRYQDIADQMKTIVTGKEAGLVLGYWMGGMPGVYWWRKKDMSGGQAVEQTIHIFDLCRYLFGEVKEVFAVARTGLMKEVEGYDVEDATAATLTFKNGLIGTIFSACFLKAVSKTGLDIYLKDVALSYAERTSLTITEPNRCTEIKVGNDFGQMIDETFIEAVRTGDGSAIRSPYADAVKSLALSLAVNESLRLGKSVSP
ncbi:MAG: Gfo/Idh/MocA family oxidoreductase [Candidatus Omnitrophota bacterium]